MDVSFEVNEKVGRAEGLDPGWYFVDPMGDLQGPFTGKVKSEEARILFKKITTQLKEFYD